jgi:hypothetical protein
MEVKTLALNWPELPENYHWDYITGNPDCLVEIVIWNDDATTKVQGYKYLEHDAVVSDNVEADLQRYIDILYAGLELKIQQFEADQRAASERAAKVENARSVIAANCPEEILDEVESIQGS